MAPDRKNRYGWAWHATRWRAASGRGPYRGASYGVSSAKAFCAQHG